jgi:hypothetical protein
MKKPPSIGRISRVSRFLAKARTSKKRIKKRAGVPDANWGLEFPCCADSEAQGGQNLERQDEKHFKTCSPRESDVRVRRKE